MGYSESRLLVKGASTFLGTRLEAKYRIHLLDAGLPGRNSSGTPLSNPEQSGHKESLERTHSADTPQRIDKLVT